MSVVSNTWYNSVLFIVSFEFLTPLWDFINDLTFIFLISDSTGVRELKFFGAAHSVSNSDSLLDDSFGMRGFDDGLFESILFFKSKNLNTVFLVP